MTARDRILELLRARGDANVAELSAATGLADVTVRHHVGRLREEGLLEVRTERIGRGRPRHVYRLSPSAIARLDGDGAYEDLAEGLLRAIKDGDTDAGERFFRAMALAATSASGADRAAALPVADRLDLAVRVLAEQGFVTRWEADPDGYVVRASDCPFRSLSARDSDVCCFDREVIRRVVGGEVTRVSWVHAGDGPCAYRVRPEFPTLE